MIYFVRFGDVGPIKIGFTKAGNMESRMVALQVGAPVKLKICGYMRGGIGVERKLHERFSEDRLIGEWFKPTSELLDFMQRNTQKYAKKRGIEIDVLGPEGSGPDGSVVTPR